MRWLQLPSYKLTSSRTGKNVAASSTKLFAHCLVSSGRVRTSLCRLAGIARTGRNAIFMCCPGVGLSTRRRAFSSFTENPHQATLVTLRLNCNQHTTHCQSTEHTEQVAGAAVQLHERGLVAKAP